MIQTLPWTNRSHPTLILPPYVRSHNTPQASQQIKGLKAALTAAHAELDASKSENEAAIAAAAASAAATAAGDEAAGDQGAQAAAELAGAKAALAGLNDQLSA